MLATLTLTEGSSTFQCRVHPVNAAVLTAVSRNDRLNATIDFTAFPVSPDGAADESAPTVVTITGKTGVTIDFPEPLTEDERQEARRRLDEVILMLRESDRVSLSWANISP